MKRVHHGAPGETKSQKGCYIATCVYGSYDCPAVWVLRCFRDYTLADTWYGRAFIKFYYAVSPSMVKWFGNIKPIRNFWKKCLDRFVKKLRIKGYADDPYQD